MSNEMEARNAETLTPTQEKIRHEIDELAIRHAETVRQLHEELARHLADAKEDYERRLADLSERFHEAG